MNTILIGLGQDSEVDRVFDSHTKNPVGLREQDVSVC